MAGAEFYFGREVMGGLEPHLLHSVHPVVLLRQLCANIISTYKRPDNLGHKK